MPRPAPELSSDLDAYPDVPAVGWLPIGVALGSEFPKGKRGGGGHSPPMDHGGLNRAEPRSRDGWALKVHNYISDPRYRRKCLGAIACL